MTVFAEQMLARREPHLAPLKIIYIIYFYLLSKFTTEMAGKFGHENNIIQK